MSRRLLIVLSLLCGLAPMGVKCRPASGPLAISVLSPTAGALVNDCAVHVLFLAPEVGDPSMLTVLLNGQPLAPLAVVPPSPNAFEVTVPAGPPLLASNTLQIDGPNLATEIVNFDFQAPPPSAREITSASELVGGPLGHSRIGDWLLENCVARFVVQDVGQRDLHSVGQYGGNLIDAELRARPDRDQFFEFQPALNIETVVNAQEVEVVNDGQAGGPAILRTCGPDDLLDYVNASSQAAELSPFYPPGANDFDQNVEACTEYSLEAGKDYVKVETIVSNPDPTAVGLYVGDYLNGMGSLEQWTPPNGGVGEILVTPNEARFQSLFGFGPGEGVDYALVPEEFAGVQPIPPTPTTSFSTSGVTFVAQSHSILAILGFGIGPQFQVPAASGGQPGQNSFVRYFGVGDGSPSNAVDLRADVLGLSVGSLSGCVTVGGAPAPGARVAVGPLSSGSISQVASIFVTDDDGCYEGDLPPGSYGAAASREGTPYQGGGPTPAVVNVSVLAGQATTGVDIALPTTGGVSVSVVDEGGAPVPARVSVVGFDPSPEPQLSFNNSVVGTVRTGLFRDITKDPLPFGLAWIEYTDAAGQADFDLEPGTYQLVVSRGTEYSAFETPITVTAGQTTGVAAQIARVVDTAGFISSDYHVHMLNSPDSRISVERRVASFAGEGVDNIIATDHDAHTDLDPVIADLGFTPFVNATIGEEITTFDYGHFNGYPQALDPSRVSGGSTDWAGAAPPGQDFPSLGNFVLTPAQVHAAAVGNPLNAGLGTVVQVNHIGSHFGPLKIDTSLPGGPASLLSDAEKQEFRLCSTAVTGSCAAAGNLFHHFPALELWNGANAGAQSAFLDERIGVWMNHLNQGLITTAIADTDTHTVIDLEQAGARTWTPSSSDAPAGVSDAEIAAAVTGGKAVGGQGLYVQTRLLATDGSGGVADHTLSGSTLVPVANGEVDLEIDVQGPLWAPYDTIEIYTNATTCVSGTNGGVPVEFGGVPSQVLTLGATDTGTEFTAPTVQDYPGIPGAAHRETTRVVRLSGLAADTWVVVVAKGTAGVSEPMFPVFPRDLASGSNTTLADLLDGNLGEGGTRALGFTNALYVDVDGGGFQAPGVPTPLPSCP